MKKKVIKMLGILMMTALLAGCGGKESGSGASNEPDSQNVSQPESDAETGETSQPEGGAETAKTPVTADMALKDIAVEEYVTLCDYKALKIMSQPASPEVIEQNTWSLYARMYPEDMRVMDRAVVLGDTANIDFEGKKDGVAFQGGTAQGSDLKIGSGQFIDGFEDGLIGVMPGETVDLSLTFPEGYGNAELAGQAVIFTVKVNYIVPDGIEDAAVEAMGISGITDAAGFRKYVEDSVTSYYRETMENETLSTFVNGCTFDTMPEVLVEKFRQNLRNNMEMSAAAQNMEVENYMSQNYGMDLETFVNGYAEQSLKLNMACQAVANREQLNISDEELDTMLKEYADQAGYTTVEEYMGDTPREEFREYFMYLNVVEYLTNLASGQA